jgi:uncharacterized protein (TIGR03083 family)
MNQSIDTLSLFPVLNRELIGLLHRLSPDDWQKQTVAKQWKIKDVVSHLLDGNLRRISLNRDGWFPVPDMEIRTDDDLVRYLNTLNADWVKATRRLSPAILVDLLASTNDTVYELFSGLDPHAPSTYPVSWAGHLESPNWFDIAREYTERWLHQQQIRHAIGDEGIMTKELYHPLLDIFMHAWPVAAAGTGAVEGAVLRAVVTGNGGGEWSLKYRNEQWLLTADKEEKFLAETIIDGREAWKLFSKSIRMEDVQDHYTIKGNKALGEVVLKMVSVMA